MSLVDVGVTPFFQQIRGDTANATSLVDAASEVCGFVGTFKAGTLTHLHWRTGTVTTGATVDIRVETVSASGDATGTLWGTNTNGTQVVADADDNTWFRTALTAGAVFNHGDVAAVLVVNPAVSVGNFQVILATDYSALFSQFPYRLAATRTTKQTTGIPAFLFEYSDGSFLPVMGYMPFVRLAGLTLDTGTDPNEAGILFTPQVPCLLAGYGANLNVALGADYRVVCYQDGNTTPMVSTGSRDGDIRASTGGGLFTGLFTGTVALVAGTPYRLTIVPLTTGDVALHRLEVPQASAFMALSQAQVQLTTRLRSSTTDPDSAAWTQTATQLPALWPLVSQFDNGAGGAAPGRRDYPYGARRTRRAPYAA